MTGASCDPLTQDAVRRFSPGTEDERHCLLIESQLRPQRKSPKA